MKNWRFPTTDDRSYTFQDDANATRSDRRSNRLRRSQNEQLSAQPSEQPVAPTVAA